MKVYIATYENKAEFENEKDETIIIGVYATELLAEAQRKFYKGKMFEITEYEIIS